jgi:hypothetical protein
MAAADMSVWRRQNSDIHGVEMILIDGSRLKGNLLVSRDKSMRDFFNQQTEDFIDFDCKLSGMIVIAKSSIRQIRAEDSNKKGDQAKIDALAARQAELDKADPHKLLGVPVTVDADALHKAYIGKARSYHPDRFLDSNLPQEVMDYLNAMARRINSAYEDLNDDLAAKAAAAEKAAAKPAGPPKYEPQRR